MASGFTAIRQANAETDRLQIHIDMEKPPEYDSELHDQYWKAWDKKYVIFELYIIVFVVNGVGAGTVLVVMAIVVSKKSRITAKRSSFL